MLKTKKQEFLIFLIIVGVASFFRLYQLDIFPPGLEINAWPLRIFSAIIGILTVIGLYLLTKELFEWRLAAIASFLLAISFWHVNFSRIGLQAITLPFVLVYAFYFLWKGIKHNHLPDFIIAGIFGGLGFYTDTSYCVAPLMAIALFVNYWWYLKKDFYFSKYEHAKNQLLRGFALFAITAIIVALPIGFYFWQHPGELMKQTVELRQLPTNIVKTLEMFNFSDNPMLPWPIGVFFAVGFINELIHWAKRKHGHFSTVHTLIFAWFFTMLLPGFLSIEAPDALKTIGVLPVVMIFIARGIWLFFDKLSTWYSLNDPHSKHEAHAITALVMIVFLFSIGFMEYWRYFK